LGYAHEQGLIHRDVKPSNILLTQKGQPMLTDFGIAKLLELDDGHTLTGAGVGIGTPEYMAPEQALGKAVDGRADLYSLGIVFYELVTGRKPFTAETPMAVVFKHMTDPLPRPTQYVPDLPEAVEKVLIKALAKQSENRYDSMEAFVVAMEGLVAGQFLPQVMPEPIKTSVDSQATIDELNAIEIDTPTQNPISNLPPAHHSILKPLNLETQSKIKKYFPITVVLGVLIFMGALVTLRAGWIGNGSVVGLFATMTIRPGKTATLTLMPTTSQTPILTATPQPSPTELVFSSSTPLSTASRFQIPRPAAQNNASTPQVAPVFFENFDNPKYDGGYDFSRWRLQGGNLPKPVQVNGFLSFVEPTAIDDHEVALGANSPEQVLLSQIRYIQGDLALGSDANAGYSHAAINLIMNNPVKGDLWIEANLVNSKNHPTLLCEVHYLTKTKASEYEGKFDPGLQYDQFYTVRIQFDPATFIIKWFVNNELACNVKSREYADNFSLSALFILNSYRSVGSHITTYADNIIVGK
jgi:serine/threonine protein kinase